MSKVMIVFLCLAAVASAASIPFMPAMPAAPGVTAAPIPPAVVEYVNAKLSGKIDPLTGGITPVGFPKSGMPPSVADFIKGIIGETKADI